MNRCLSVSTDHGHFIGDGVKAHAFARNVVSDDCIEILSGQFLARIGENVFSFCGKANDQQIVPIKGRDVNEYVSGAFEFERVFSACLLDLLRR